MTLSSWLTPATLWGLAAAIPAVSAEFLYRRLTGPWHEYLWLWVPIALAVSYCVCQLVRQPNTALIDAFIVWAFSTTFLRVVVSVFVLGDVVKAGTWFALALLIMARIAQTYWGR